jgi:hypothetical protein
MIDWLVKLPFTKVRGFFMPGFFTRAAQPLILFGSVVTDKPVANQIRGYDDR